MQTTDTQPTTPARTIVPLGTAPRRYSEMFSQGAFDLVLDGRESPRTFDARVLLKGAGLDVALESALLSRYPDASGLEARIAHRFDVEPAKVIVTAGADDAIDRICRSFLGPGRVLLQAKPTFQMIGTYATSTGAKVKDVDWAEGAFPLDAFRAQAHKEPPAVIAAVTPNNPTGLTLTPSDIRALATEFPSTLIMLDLAYVDFSDSDPTALALEHPNVVVLRTFSKAWGLSGLRVGYAIGANEVIDRLRRTGAPYAVSGMSLTIVERLLDAGLEKYVEATIARVRDERTSIGQRLEKAGFHVTLSQGNFVFARSVDTPRVVRGLAEKGIAVRSFCGETALSDAMRISCPGAAEPAVLETILRSLDDVLKMTSLREADS